MENSWNLEKMDGIKWNLDCKLKDNFFFPPPQKNKIYYKSKNTKKKYMFF